MKPENILINSKFLNIYIVVYVLFIIISLVANLRVLYIYIRTKRYLKPVNFVSIGLTFLNLVTILCYLSHYTIGLYLRRVPFGDIGCLIQGFFALFTGTAGLWILALLSINRYCLVFYPLYLSHINVKHMLSILGIYFLVNVLWGLLPIFGWSDYSYEFNGLQCAMNYNSNTLSVISFNITTLIFFWLIPISIGCYTNYKILLIVR